MQKLFLIAILCLLSNIIHAQETLLQDPISITFRQDTMMIEQRVSDMLHKDYTPEGLVKASVFLEQEYDNLLTRYYQMLLNKMREEDKNILIESQQNWKKYRDSEKKLLYTISSDTYTGEGGSFWAIPVATSTYADITRDRLINIYNYIVFNIME